jgi:putative ABC transport system permease protein
LFTILAQRTIGQSREKPGASNHSRWPLAHKTMYMLSNYLKVAIRYLMRHKEYTAINILGLAVGITCCVLIMLFVRSEWSYDKFHSKSERLFRVWQHEKYQGEDFINTATPIPMGPALQNNFAEIEATCRVYPFSPIVKVNNQSFSEDVRMVDSTVFRMFDFNLVRGDRNNPFPTANSMVITPELAKKYFGKQDPIGKSIEIQMNDKDKVLFTVSGVAEPAPEASSIKYKLLISYSNSKYIFSERAHKSWFNVYGETYVLLNKNAKAAGLQKKFPAMMKQQLGEDYTENGFLIFLQPIADIHLNNTLPVGIEPISNPKYSYILASIGILILLVACVNFITLSIGRSTTRALEVGVRKALGAARKQLVRQFWGEAFLVTFLSVVVGLALSAALVKPFNQLINRELSLQFDWIFFAFCVLLVAIIAIIAGIYPALVLSGFNPVEVLKGKLKMKSNTGWLRQGLIVGQFIASIGMIVCTIVIQQQMNYLKTKDLGYNKDQVIVVQTNKSIKEAMPLAELYRTELTKSPQVSDVAVSVYSFNETPWVSLGFTDDKKVYKSFQYNTIDARFIPAMGIKVLRGRAFDENNPADLTMAAVVNEAFVKEFNLGDAVGKKLPGKFEQQIIGVVKDFNYESLHTPVNPLMMTMKIDSVVRRTENINVSSPAKPRISVRMKPGNLANNVEVLRQAWKKVLPNQDFEYQFLDESIAAQYQQEQRTSTIVKLASGLSIFIACMGLFGLATLTVVRRTKEIGIRKVLGANIPAIVGLLSKDFVKLVIIAALIAFPLAWWAMGSWLEDFAYRVKVGWWVYVLAGLASLVIALVTVSFQAVRAALSNPVKSLRTE